MLRLKKYKLSLLASIGIVLLSMPVLGQEHCCLSHKFVFNPPKKEIGCFRHFNPDVVGVDPVNAYLLAKMNELMYTERLDFEMRLLQQGNQFYDELKSTDQLKEHPLIDNCNFKSAYEQRFGHFFSNEEVKAADFYFIKKARLDTSNFLGIHSVKGCDPELIVIDHNSTILILYRGTDDILGNRYAEWKGTDFNFSKIHSDSNLNRVLVHEGFWKSFDLIKNELILLLDSLDAKNKKIWLTGHSLGGSMAILSGVYLSKLGYPVNNVYTYATPRQIGKKGFRNFADSLLDNRIHRFEYYLDPVTLLWAPGYKPIGKRHWFDNATKGNYQCYYDCQERKFFWRPFYFHKSIFATKNRLEQQRIKEEQLVANIFKIPCKIFYHNTQWYVKSTYKLVPEELRDELPSTFDSFPFIYYGWDKSK